MLAVKLKKPKKEKPKLFEKKKQAKKILSS